MERKRGGGARRDAQQLDNAGVALTCRAVQRMRRKRKVC
jgi:hypothetical protein